MLPLRGFDEFSNSFSEARSQEPKEKRRESVNVVLSLIFWLLTPDS
jgi:hypothetical protein